MGGGYNLGAVFSIDQTATFKLLHSFDGPDGSWPRASLLQTLDGNFFGTTSAAVKATTEPSSACSRGRAHDDP